MPLKKLTFSTIIQRCLVYFVGICFLLSACNTKNPGVDVQPSLSTISEKTHLPTSTITIEPVTPTATSTLLPPSDEKAPSARSGLIIFSMADGEYKHLFAYHPSYLQVTRLTGDAWDDDSPAVSPDGNKIAFTSTRFGTREIYILDLVENTLAQMTNSSAFEGTISWSPDGQYIVYDVYQNGYYDLIIQSVNNQTEQPIKLTSGKSNSFQPSWSPKGDEVAFVSDQSGRNEIWLARLQSTDDFFVRCIGKAETDYSHPTWSPDGLFLAVHRHQTDDEIVLIDPHNPDTASTFLGKGKNPVWLPDGSGVLATLKLPNQTEILAYAINDHHLMLPPIPMAGSLFSYDWKAGNLSENIQLYLSRNPIVVPPQLWVDQAFMPSEENERQQLVPLDGVDAPQAILSDAVDDNFHQLRSLVELKAGWDVLKSLENAAISSTTVSMPGIAENWLYTGRAIALNLAPYEADWMVVSREEFAGDLYWRVWIKCKIQDGNCGEPLDSPVWDFKSRSSGQLLAYENGGEIVSAPSGYWVDFTELALRLGWERLSSLNNWRTYFPGILFNTFVLRQGLSWREALLELYPQEQVDLIIRNNQ